MTMKSQWEAYMQLSSQGATAAAVAVRKDDSSEWKPVGHVCVTNGGGTTAAAARQRALIAEHGKRVHLALKALGKAPVQVGVRVAVGTTTAYAVVGKEDDTLPDGVQCGFEGVADASTGLGKTIVV
jgi:hypothetical protein